MSVKSVIPSEIYKYMKKRNQHVWYPTIWVEKKKKTYILHLYTYELSDGKKHTDHIASRMGTGEAARLLL